MTRRMIWGVATLIILIIGVSAFLLTRTPETEPEIIYNPLTPAEKAEVDRNIQDVIDTAQKDLSPIAEKEHQEMPNNNSQQSGSVEPVLVENYLEGLEDIDLFASITIPTDAQIAKYTRSELLDYMDVIEKAVGKSREILQTHNERLESIVAAGKALSADDKLYVEKSLQLADQSRERLRFSRELAKQKERLNQESRRIHDYLGRL